MPVTGFAGSAASESFYKIDVPAGQTKLEIKISGGTGDADLYVRVGDKPTTQDWDYRPFVLGNNETVTIDEPKAGTYYIMIRGYMAYTGVTLKATYGPESEQIKTLDNCVPVMGLSGDQDSETLFKIDVPADQNSLHIEISGGTGDADLYVKKGEQAHDKELGLSSRPAWQQRSGGHPESRRGDVVHHDPGLSGLRRGDPASLLQTELQRRRWLRLHRLLSISQAGPIRATTSPPTGQLFRSHSNAGHFRPALFFNPGGPRGVERSSDRLVRANRTRDRRRQALAPAPCWSPRCSGSPPRGPLVPRWEHPRTRRTGPAPAASAGRPSGTTPGPASSS